MLNSKNIKVVLFLLLSVSVVFIYFTQSYNSVTSTVFKKEDESSFISRNVLTEEKENTWRENPRPIQQLNITTVRVEDIAQLSNEIGVKYILEKKLALALADSGEIDLDIGEPDLGETDEPMDTDIPVLFHPVRRRMLNKDDFNQLMKERQVHLQKSCQDIFKQQRQNPVLHRIPRLKPSVFYTLPEIKFAWCPVYKAASTNWMHNLLHLANLTPEQISKVMDEHPRQPNDQGRVVAPPITENKLKDLETLQHSKRLLIVRHPFDRLVSAFRDKLERCHGLDPCILETNWYYKTYGRGMVSNHRRAAIQRFSEQYFSPENNFGSPLPVEKTWRSADLPSWWEFIQYILETSPEHYDEHWRPMSMYCAACSFSYNYILHFENINQEEMFFAEELGAKDKIQHRWENRNDEGFKKEELVGKYFSLLNESEIEKLYQIYKDDFQLFGYQFQFRDIKLNMP